MRSLDVETHATTEKIRGIQASEEQVCVGHCDFCTDAIAGGPGCRAGAVRADSQAATLIDVRD